MRPWSNSIDPATIPEDILRSEWARRNSGKRKTFGAGPGRPRIAPRCACGTMTLSRAKKRKHLCGAPPPASD